LFCLVYKNVKGGGKYYGCQKDYRRKITWQKKKLWEVENVMADKKNMVRAGLDNKLDC
jgi:hypothetical protein